LTGSSGSIPIFLKNQNDIVLVKKKINGLQPDFVGSTRQVSRVTPGHDFFYFFFNPAWFQPRVDRVLDRPFESGRISKINI
jgi:hypothetical protein